MLQPSDRKYDQNQTPKLPAKNQQFGAQTFQTLKDMILNLVQAGAGVRVERRGLRVFIHATGAGGKGMGAMAGGVTWYQATTKAGLDNDSVSRHSFGIVVGVGSDHGMFCIRNPDKDGWDAINFLE